MKKIKALLGLSAMLFILTFSNANAQAGCTQCGSGLDECYRIISGNQVHIYHGEVLPFPGGDT